MLQTGYFSACNIEKGMEDEGLQQAGTILIPWLLPAFQCCMLSKRATLKSWEEPGGEARQVLPYSLKFSRIKYFAVLPKSA